MRLNYNLGETTVNYGHLAVNRFMGKTAEATSLVSKWYRSFYVNHAMFPIETGIQTVNEVGVTVGPRTETK
jgi:hypothetical protein